MDLEAETAGSRGFAGHLVYHVGAVLKIQFICFAHKYFFAAPISQEGAWVCFHKRELF